MHEFRGQLVIEGTRVARDDVAALRQELQAAGGDLAKIGKAAPAAGTIGQQAVAARSPWEQLAGSMEKARAAMAAMNKGGSGNKLGKSGPGDAQDTTKQSKSLLDRMRAAIGKDASKAASQAAGIGARAGGLVMAAAGVAGALSLAKLALGYRGMAQLQAITYRTQYQLRSLFRGVDSGPAVRAADRFFNSLFSRGSVAGRALEGMLTRGFNGFFQFLEKAQPYATAFFEGMILGALMLENTWLRVRIALLPVTTALSDAIGPIDGVKAAAVAGAVALGALGLAALGAAAPFVAAATAVGALISQIQQLRAEWDNMPDFGAIKRQLGKDLGFTTQDDADQAAYIRGRGEYEKAEAKRRGAAAPQGAPDAAKPAGAAAGKAYADGMVQGAAAGQNAVEAAGGALVNALDKGVRAKGQIHSPSKLARDTARQFPAGAAEGIDDGRADVQAAAARSMVPQVPGGAGARGAVSTARSGPTELHIHLPNVTSGNPAEVRAAVREGVAGVDWRSIALALGLSPELAAA